MVAELGRRQTASARSANATEASIMPTVAASAPETTASPPWPPPSCGPSPSRSTTVPTLARSAPITIGSAFTEDLLVAACTAGADLIGGCPYTDSDPYGQIARIFALAERFDLDDVVVLDCADPAAAVAELAQPVLGLKRGRPTFTRPLPVLHRPYA